MYVCVYMYVCACVYEEHETQLGHTPTCQTHGHPLAKGALMTEDDESHWKWFHPAGFG